MKAFVERREEGNGGGCMIIVKQSTQYRVLGQETDMEFIVI